MAILLAAAQRVPAPESIGFGQATLPEKMSA
jgi:hypothetical protein